MNSEFFSAEIIADVLSISKRDLQSWISNGKLIPKSNLDKNHNIYHKKQLQQFPEFQSLFNSRWDEEEKIKPKRDFKLVELFAGAGGLALGLEQAGLKTILLNEINKDACKTLRINRPKWNIIEDDITNVSFSHLEGKVDLLTGGFPCQAFSYAGKKLGFEDTRGTMFFEFARTLQEIKPKVFLAENVRGLLSHDNGRTLETIINIIDELGYTLVENNIYKSLFYKVPQKRERLILIGVKKDLVNKTNFIPPSPYKRILTVKDALKAGELYSEDVPNSEGQKYPERKKEILEHVPEGGYWRDLPLELQKEYMKGSFFLGGGKTGMARRLSWNEPSLTLTCAPAQKQTERCHPQETRPLTTREYARIQTFPDDWIFQGSISSIYKQIGNAVPVNMAAAIGRSIVRLLNSI
jgi:DNA (cytosine-5)-methyltransferase 1